MINHLFLCAFLLNFKTILQLFTVTKRVASTPGKGKCQGSALEYKIKHRASII